MRILITNDDGYQAAGIVKLAEIATQIADEVYVVAPAGNRSAISHGISVTEPLILKKIDFPIKVTESYSCSGTPADCVKVALNALLADKKPDLVLSGINHGFNMGYDTVYSGTVAAARDAVYQGVKAMAISTYGAQYELVDLYLKDILLDLLQREVLTHEIWNINFPKCGEDGYRGVKETTPAAYPYYLDTYQKEQVDENTWKFTLLDELCDREEGNSDFAAVEEGFISIEKLECSLLKK